MYSMEASSLASPCYELEDEIEGSGYLCLSSFYFLVYCYDLCPFCLEGEFNTWSLLFLSVDLLFLSFFSFKSFPVGLVDLLLFPRSSSSLVLLPFLDALVVESFFLDLESGEGDYLRTLISSAYFFVLLAFFALSLDASDSFFFVLIFSYLSAFPAARALPITKITKICKYIINNT